MHVCVLSCFSFVRLFVTPWIRVRQSLLSMEFSKQEYWSELPCPLPGDLLDPGIKPCLSCLLHWQASSQLLAPPKKHQIICIMVY